MKKILFIIMFISTGYLFSQETKVFETSNNFTEIMGAFQRRLHGASLEYKYFFHAEDNFDIEDEYVSQLFDKKAMKIIGRNKYFIFETNTGDVYLLLLVNKEDAKSIAFLFINERLEEAIPCSEEEIDKALASYLEL